MQAHAVVMAENMGFMIRYNTNNNASQVGRQRKPDSLICQVLIDTTPNLIELGEWVSLNIETDMPSFVTEDYQNLPL